MPDLFLHDAYVNDGGRWVLLAVAFAFGAVLGSFLNVVAYRLPRRMSLSWPGSHCPACGKPIRWHDNVPIAGWLWLGGRCRDCHAAISPRYPIVETIAALASAVLAWSEMFVPMPAADVDGQGAFALQFGPYAFHMLLLCTLLAAALVELDGQRPPPRMITLAMTLGLAIGGMWPSVRFDALWGATHTVGVTDGIVGGLAAAILAALAWPAWIDRGEKRQAALALTAAAELVLVGVFLGTRETAWAAALAMLIHAAGRLLARAWPLGRQFVWAGCLWLATLVTIVGLRVSPRLESSVVEYDASTTLIAAGSIVAVLALSARWLGPRAAARL